MGYRYATRQRKNFTRDEITERQRAGRTRFPQANVIARSSACASACASDFFSQCPPAPRDTPRRCDATWGSGSATQTIVDSGPLKGTLRREAYTDRTSRSAAPPRPATDATASRSALAPKTRLNASSAKIDDHVFRLRWVGVAWGGTTPGRLVDGPLRFPAQGALERHGVEGLRAGRASSRPTLEGRVCTLRATTRLGSALD